MEHGEPFEEETPPHPDTRLELTPPNDPVWSGALIALGVIAIGICGLLFISFRGLSSLGW